MKKITRIVNTIALACAASTADASLINRGNGFIYDDVLDITWLQNAHLAASNTFGVSGIEADGQMVWDTANLWISAMNVAGYKGFHNWRMPTVRPLNGESWNLTVSYDGSTDKGYNNYSTSMELSNLFYSTLGNLGVCNTSGGCGGGANGYAEWGLINTGPFLNFTNVDRYWTKIENPANSARAFDFDFERGQTGTGNKDGTFFVWAVLDGDVAKLTAVPVPAAAWLFGSGLLGLVGVAQRKAR